MTKYFFDEREFVAFLHSQCGKTRNSLPHKYFTSNQLTVKFFSKTLIWRIFCEKTVAVNFRNYHTVRTLLWKLWNFTVTVFIQNFCQINVLLKNFTVNWFDEKICVAENLSFFHTLFRVAQCWKKRNFLSPKNISSNQLFSKFFSKNVSFTKFLQKSVIE